MSAWRLLVKALAERGGEAKCYELVKDVGLRIGRTVHTARGLGLVEKPERMGRGVPCRLSALGWAFARQAAVVVRYSEGPGKPKLRVSVRLVEEVQS
jgi:hypothetical protein